MVTSTTTVVARRKSNAVWHNWVVNEVNRQVNLFLGVVFIDVNPLGVKPIVVLANSHVQATLDTKRLHVRLDLGVMNRL
jgi:hypothetical protein